MVKVLISWLLKALALIAVAYLVPNIYVANIWIALVAALIIGLANILIKPILVIFTLPITLITLGLFIFVINGLLFWAVGHFLQGFEVRTVLAGIIGAIVYSVISWVLSAIIIKKD
ncbi:MAG: phage holin family protein [Methylophilus sp.]